MGTRCQSAVAGRDVRLGEWRWVTTGKSTICRLPMWKIHGFSGVFHIMWAFTLMYGLWSWTTCPPDPAKIQPAIAARSSRFTRKLKPNFPISWVNSCLTISWRNQVNSGELRWTPPFVDASTPSPVTEASLEVARSQALKFPSALAWKRFQPGTWKNPLETIETYGNPRNWVWKMSWVRLIFWVPCWI